MNDLNCTYERTSLQNRIEKTNLRQLIVSQVVEHVPICLTLLTKTRGSLLRLGIETRYFLAPSNTVAFKLVNFCFSVSKYWGTILSLVSV